MQIACCYLFVLYFSLLTLHFVVVVIGFNNKQYATDENSESVAITVSVLFGTLNREVEVSFFTENGTAGCKSHNSLVRYFFCC